MTEMPRAKRRWWMWGAAVVLLLAIAAGLSIRSTIKTVPMLFRKNAERKAQGCYMGEFEFKMLAVQYYLNEGSYSLAWDTLQRIRREMETAQGLVRMPQNASPQQQMAFLLDRQDPSTGAFMDPRYPYFTYFAPTENVIEALHNLARQMGRMLKLKYPLRFLDQIREPERLRAYLDSLLYMREPWSRIAAGPGPYGPGVSELASYARLEELGLYEFSAEWKEALLCWLLDTQDPATGFWGYRIGTPQQWMQHRDVNSTYHVLKLFGAGEVRYPGPLARSLIHYIDRPVPEDTSEQHEWGLVQAQGTRMVAWLWDQLSDHEREQARKAMAVALKLRYERFFRPVDGGFSLYTSGKASDVDGTANALALLRATGSMPGTRERQRLWGKAIAASPAPVRREVRSWQEATAPAGTNAHSLRVYAGDAPAADNYDDSKLLEIIAIGDSPVRDVMELRWHIARLLASSGQTFGNWASKEGLQDQPLDLRREIRAVPVTSGSLDLARISLAHPRVRTFAVVGYDVFQVPVLRLEYVLQR